MRFDYQEYDMSFIIDRFIKGLNINHNEIFSREFFYDAKKEKVILKLFLTETDKDEKT